MSGLSRRRFIGGAAAGAIAVTAATAVPGIAAAAPDDSPDDGNELSETVVARVRNLRTGEIALYVGDAEITHTDRTLARRLARAAAR